MSSNPVFAITKLMGAAALVVVAAGPAAAETIEVRQLKYFSPATGGDRRIRNIETVAPSEDVSAQLQEVGIDPAAVLLHCGGNPGPRFVQIDGTFYPLNGKAMRQRARAVARTGDEYPLIETNASGSPLADEWRLIQSMIDDAARAC